VDIGPGEITSFNFSLENRGNSADTFTVSFGDVAADWAAAAPAEVTLDPEQETTITVTVTVPTGAALGEYRLGVIATADDGQTDRRRTLTLEVEVPVTETHSLELCFTMPSGDCLSQRALEVAVEQGEIQTGTYGFRVTNNGNSDAEISLTLTLPSGSTDWLAGFTDGGGNRWYVRLDPDTADYPLQLTPGGQMDWGALVINNHKLAAGGSYAFTLTAEVFGQPGTAQQLSVTVTVTEPDAPPPTDEEGGGLPAPSLLAVLLLLGGVALRRRR
jgi:MYXO-CTERM domain-containing protein